MKIPSLMIQSAAVILTSPNTTIVKLNNNVHILPIQEYFSLTYKGKSAGKIYISFRYDKGNSNNQWGNQQNQQQNWGNNQSNNGWNQQPNNPGNNGWGNQPQNSGWGN